MSEDAGPARSLRLNGSYKYIYIQTLFIIARTLLIFWLNFDDFDQPTLTEATSKSLEFLTFMVNAMYWIKNQ
jgi:hypothetical protein